MKANPRCADREGCGWRAFEGLRSFEVAQPVDTEAPCPRCGGPVECDEIPDGMIRPRKHFGPISVGRITGVS